MPAHRYDVRVLPVARIPTAVISRRVSRSELSRVVPECCGLVWAALRAQGLKGGRNVALYRERGAVVEAGVELQTPFSPEGEIVLSELPAGRAATAIHYGPYQDMGAAHEAVQEWCKANGQEFGSVCWEIYGHWQDAWNSDPSQIRTDVFYELA
jgi:effector-binding domain-containing protein